MIDSFSRGRSDHTQLGGRHPFSTADDQRRRPGRQRRQFAAPRSDVQDGARPSPIDRDCCARSRQYRGWRICRTFAPCCGWAGRWSICICEFFAVWFPKRITSWTSTTRSMRPTGVSSCGCSTAHYDEYGFQPTRRVRRRGPLHHRRASSAASGSAHQGSSPSSRSPVVRDPRSLAFNTRDPACGPTAIIAAPRSSIGVARERPRLHPRHRANHDIAPPCRRSRSQHEVRVSRPRRGTVSFVVSRNFSMARKAEAWLSGSSPRVEAGAGGTGHPLRRHQSAANATPRRLYEDL